METSKQRIQAELLPLAEKANVLIQRLMREQGYMRDSLEKVQYHFRDQEPGRALINELTQSMREVQCAYCEQEQLKGAVVEFTHVLTE